MALAKGADGKAFFAQSLFDPRNLGLGSPDSVETSLFGQAVDQFLGQQKDFASDQFCVGGRECLNFQRNDLGTGIEIDRPHPGEVVEKIFAAFRAIEPHQKISRIVIVD